MTQITSVGTITPAAFELLNDSTTDAMLTTLSAASSTTKAMSYLVYDGTPSAGDLTTYDEIYTTPALCFAALPAIINHAVTITMRKADGAAYAAATLQRVVAGGSITIQGEYYYNDTVASAGSGTGKFNVIAGHSGLIQAGDKIFLMKYSGTVGSSTPSDGFVDTVASVDGTEVTLTTRTTDTFDTSWRYVIVRTECTAITISATNMVTITGLYFSSSGTAVTVDSGTNNKITSCIFSCSGSIAIQFNNVFNGTTTIPEYIGINHTYTGTLNRSILIVNGSVRFYNTMILSEGTGTSTNTSARGFYIVQNNASGQIRYGYLKLVGSGTTDGVTAIDTSRCTVINLSMDGVDVTYKIKTALNAFMGSIISVSNVTFGSNITTQKSPANWAATTDGSYIS